MANAKAFDAGRPRPHTNEDMQVLVLAVDVAAKEVRDAGCDIDDLVGSSVGRLDG